MRYFLVTAVVVLLLCCRHTGAAQQNTHTQPATDPVECVIDAPSKIEYETNRRKFIQEKFLLKVHLIGNEQTFTAIGLEAGITVPRGYVLAPSAQPLWQQLPDTISIGDTATFEWQLAPDNRNAIALGDPFTADIKYRNISNPSVPISGTCSRPEAQMIELTIPHLNIVCANLSGPGMILFDDYRYTTSTFKVEARIENRGAVPVIAKEAQLFLARGMSADIHPDDRSRFLYFDPIPPGESVTVTWGVNIKKLWYDRDVRFTIEVFDTLDYKQAGCAGSFHIPGVNGVLSELYYPGLITYDVSTGVWTPDTFDIRLSLESTLDTSHRWPTAIIDLSQAPHLSLVDGVEAEQSSFALQKDHPRELNWKVTLADPPISDIEERVCVHYSTQLYPDGRDTCFTIRIADPAPDPACFMTVPDEILVEDGKLTHPLFTINSRIINPRFDPLSVHHAVLNLPPSIETAKDTYWQIGEIPGKDDVYDFWIVRPLRSEYDREETVSLEVFDQGNQKILECTERVFIQGVRPPVLTSHDSIDSIQYDRTERKWVPDRFLLRFDLENRTDTTNPNLFVQLRDLGETYFTNALGYPRTFGYPELGPGEKKYFEWLLIMNRVAEGADVVDTIHIEYKTDILDDWQVIPVPVAIESRTSVGVVDIPPDADTFVLGTFYPNPFVSETGFVVRLYSREMVHIAVFDALGREVAVIHSGMLNPGTHNYSWDGASKSGASAPAGLYLVRVMSGDKALTSRVVKAN